LSALKFDKQGVGVGPGFGPLVGGVVRIRRCPSSVLGVYNLNSVALIVPKYRTVAQGRFGPKITLPLALIGHYEGLRASAKGEDYEEKQCSTAHRAR